MNSEETSVYTHFRASNRSCMRRFFGRYAVSGCRYGRRDMVSDRSLAVYYILGCIETAGKARK